MFPFHAYTVYSVHILYLPTVHGVVFICRCKKFNMYTCIMHISIHCVNKNGMARVLLSQSL